MEVPKRIKEAIRLAMYHAKYERKYENEIYAWLEKNNFLSKDGADGINGFNLDLLIDGIYFNNGNDNYEELIKAFEEMVKEDEKL